MNYLEAKQIALQRNNKVNACHEYKNAYHFFNKDVYSDGDNGIVIIKGSGEVLPWISYIMKYHVENILQKRDF